MSKKKRKPDKTAAERWTVVQVAAHFGVSYQTARNNMLVGDYGPSEYDAEKRKLTVLADGVRNAKTKRGRKSTRKKSR